MRKAGINMQKLLQTLEELAPLAQAEEWDNVGLLLCPTRAPRIRRIMLTIDCTPAVVEEAIRKDVSFIIAYHPVIFSPLSSLVPQQPLERRLLRLAESRIPVYSPHTALDATTGGVNDWLAGGVQGSEEAELTPIPDGPGRLLQFKQPLSRETLAARLRRFLRVPYLRAAYPDGRIKPIRRVAVCAGAGFDAIKDTAADALVTGEMKHHDLLAAVAQGTAVFLSEHTHTERGYLPVFKKALLKNLPRQVDILIARKDRDPVRLLS